MIEDFYYRFYKYTHNKIISVFLAYLTRLFFFIIFLVKKCFLKKENLIISDEKEALRIIRETSPEISYKQNYEMAEQDPELMLSIIVPIYNHHDVIELCINSILKQKTNYLYEIILVDDGSTDGAEILLEQYRENNNITIIHQENGGVAAARNKGIENAHGRYIMFVDCDDNVYDSLVDKLLTVAISNDSDIAMCGHNLVKKTEGKVISILPMIHPQLNLLGYKNNDVIMNYAGLPWAKVYKRELFKKVRFFQGYWYEDTIIHSLVFTQCKKFDYLPLALYDYNWYEDNFTHIQAAKTAKPKSVDRYWLLKAILEVYNKNGMPHDPMFYTMLLKHLSAYYYPTISTLPEKTVQALFIVAREMLIQNRPKGKIRLSLILRITEKAILENNIALWKLCSTFQ